MLERQIPGFSNHDAMGCYPLFLCRDWQGLHSDLEDLGNDLVSLALVADPFGDFDTAYLHQCFPDMVIPFKKHFITDLSRPVNEIVSKHHRRYVKKAFEKIHVEECPEPAQYCEEWVGLYDMLINMHEIVRIRAFSKTALARQLSIPGVVLLRALHQDTTVGAMTWFVHGDVAHGHLAGITEAGYKLGAAYALFWSAIEYFSSTLRWLDFGGVPGMVDDPRHGLAFFKRGWSTGSRTAHLCGRIFDHAKYSEIVKAKGTTDTDYFPAYRKGEFT